MKTLRRLLIATTAALSAGAGVAIYNTTHAHSQTPQQRIDQAALQPVRTLPVQANPNPTIDAQLFDPTPFSTAEIERQLAEHPFYISAWHEPLPLVAIAENTPSQSGMDMEFNPWPTDRGDAHVRDYHADQIRERGIGSDYVASPPVETTPATTAATAQPRGFSVFSVLRLFNFRVVIGGPRRYASAPSRHLASASIPRKQQMARREAPSAPLTRREASSSSNESFVSVK